MSVFCIVQESRRAHVAATGQGHAHDQDHGGADWAPTRHPMLPLPRAPLRSNFDLDIEIVRSQD